MMINDLTPAERRVWEAFPRGASVDFRTADDEDAASGGGWGPERTVRAAVLRALLLGGPEEEREIAALKLTGARITGLLDLNSATVDAAVRLSHCHFEEPPRLYGAQLRRLNLRGSALPGMDAGALQIDGVLRMTDCRVRGPVGLGGVRIARALFLDGAEFTTENPAEPVLRLNQAEIGGDLWAPGMRAHGTVRLTGASVAGMVDVRGAELTGPAGPALDAPNLTVDSDVLARELCALGRLELRGSRITGRLDLMGARLSNPGDTALRASSSVIGELWLLRGDRVDGALNLRRARIDTLLLEPEVLPDEVQLSDLSYTALIPHEPAGRRLPMLERNGGVYQPYVYEQLTAAYRRIGDDDAARLVQLAKQRRRRATLPWYGRLWGRVQDVTVGYGFRPLRAAVWLLSLLAVGSVAYGLDHPAPLKADEAPDFNPVFYTLDLLLPVIDFGQERAYAPDGWHQGLAYGLVVAGWILATAIIAGVTRTVSRQ
ncbi:membrane-associated oxidoreductase [Streptomyces poonensis]|uniref:Membrane-associated oxidoreductase n=1 Tax=Streptomyces poonensis TaxID=68255 RepID=A0A918PDQ3_9ACTN|nr:membrane-associated oxidoreductase [Streptomyces poonensis]GGZ02328.1 hypothetical protein GCM10010365_21280 [Streptomyces poonensis]